MKNRFKKFNICAFAIFFILFSQINAFAGGFSVDCLGLNDIACGELIADIITLKFTDKFPVSDYQITLLAIQTKNGITTSHVSVAPKIQAPSGYTAIGTRAWVVTKIGEDLSVMGLIKTKLETCRQAVQNMMEHCEATIDCDVYNHNP
jgi:hypothetical protein